MPYRVEKPQSREITGRKALGISFPFSGPGVFSSTYDSVRAYKNNILNYFLTSRGERPLNPSFGNNIARFLFEPMLSDTQISSLRSMITNDLYTYFPRVIIRELDIVQDTEEHVLQIYLRFNIQNTGGEEELTINYNQ